MSDDKCNVNDTHVIDNGKDVCFHCAMLRGFTTLTACEQMCIRYSGCYNVAVANDVLVKHENEIGRA